MSSSKFDAKTLGSIDRRYLDFEQPIGELEEQINELRRLNSGKDLNLDEDIKRLEKKHSKLTETIFSALTPWQITQLARHPGRPFQSRCVFRRSLAVVSRYWRTPCRT